MYYDPSIVGRLGQRVNWQLISKVGSPSHQSGGQLSCRSGCRIITVCAFIGGQASDLSIGDPLVPIAPHPPSREYSARGSTTKSSNVRNNRRADQAPLRATHLVKHNPILGWSQIDRPWTRHTSFTILNPGRLLLWLWYTHHYTRQLFYMRLVNLPL
ncbi:hypothetical protein AMTR_s00072p00171660 [Amborella trichopoda]|uniref:Uncharacterized protein n=1 Tax=Amborella trichopoda TaxID=13333 RepID=W1NS77_AMBTC|nr:hypothetical protein AMTR_s00072p00171660 [Amborella trichopoda]